MPFLSLRFHQRVYIILNKKIPLHVNEPKNNKRRWKFNLVPLKSEVFTEKILEMYNITHIAIT